MQESKILISLISSGFTYTVKRKNHGKFFATSIGAISEKV
jgi:hypothetical protein